MISLICAVFLALIAISYAIGFSFFSFLILTPCLLIIVIFMALDANAKDAEKINLWNTNQLFDLKSDISLIEPKSIVKLLLAQALANVSTTVSSHPSGRQPSPFLNKRKPMLGHQRSLSNGCHFSYLNDSKNEFYTGNAKIDEQIREFVNLLIRDYICTWYSHMSHDNEFINELKSSLQIVISSVANRMSSIDCVSFLTTKFVDQFISHLRLYRTAQHHHKFQQAEESSRNLVSVFFDLEVHTQKNFSRDSFCTNLKHKSECFSQITLLIEYLLLPSDLFSNRPIRFIIRDLIVNSILIPVFDMLSDPDFVNQSLIKLCKTRKYSIPLSETFLHVIRICWNANELLAISEMIDKEISLQRSKDIGGDDDFEIKQQLSSLEYVKSLINSRLNAIKNGVPEVDSPVLIANTEITNYTNTGKLFQIPFEVIIKNNVALSYFFEYMSSVNAQSYLYFYLNVDGFKTTAEQHLSEIALIESNRSTCNINLPNIEILREAALSIYDTYLNPMSDNANRLKLDESICKKVLERINQEPLSDNWFDQVHSLVYEKMQNDEHLFPSFKKSIHYVKLLAELDLLKECQVETLSPVAELKESKCLIKNSTTSLTSVLVGDGAEDNVSIKSGQSYETQSVCSLEATDVSSTSLDELSAEIISTGITKEFGHTFGVYCISVVKKHMSNDDTNGKEDKWYVIRRYSDFYQFHQQTIKLFPQINRLEIPGKRPFHNVNQEFLNQRMKQLNTYLQQLLKLYNNPEYENIYKFNRNQLRDHIFKFIDINSINGLNQPTSATISNASSDSSIQKTVNSVLNPFKSSFKSVFKAGQDNLIDGFQKLKNLNSNSSNQFSNNQSSTSQMHGNNSSLNKSNKIVDNNAASRSFNDTNINVQKLSNKNVFNVKDRSKLNLTNLTRNMSQESQIMIESESEPNNNIPTRILLLLLDEIFELRNKNFWLRRRIIAVMKQIIQTTYRGTINKKVIRLIENLFGASAIADHIRSIKKSLWPNGFRAIPQPERSEQVRLNTKTAALMLLISTIPDDLKHIIGAETSRRGITTVFNMFQYSELNNRFLMCIFETFLIELFPNQHLDSVFERIHSFGARAQERSHNHSPSNDVECNQWPPYWNKMDRNPMEAWSAQTSSSSSSTKSSPLRMKK